MNSKIRSSTIPGYRSPLRPIPLDSIPGMMHQGGPTNDNLEYQKDCEHVLHYNNESVTNSVTPNTWWLEATRIADNVENKHDSSKVSIMVSLLYSLASLVITPNLIRIGTTGGGV